MKTRLLKKIRKRFEIVCYPEGYKVMNYDGITYEHYYKQGCVFLIDNGIQFMGLFRTLGKRYDMYSTHTMKDCVDKAKERILDYCRATYSNKRSEDRLKPKKIKVWHNPEYIDKQAKLLERQKALAYASSIIGKLPKKDE